MFFYVLLTVFVIAIAAFIILEPFRSQLHSTISKLETVSVNLLGAFGGIAGIVYFIKSSESIRDTIISVMGRDLLFAGMFIAVAGFAILFVVWASFIAVWKENIQNRDRITRVKK